MDSDLLHDQLPQLIRQTFGTNAELVNHKVVNRYHDYLVLIIQLRNPYIKVVVKLAGPGAPMASSFDRTVMFHRLVRSQTSIPMPETFALNMSFAAWPWRYLVMSYIPGQEWTAVRNLLDQDGLSAAYRQIGSAVAELHMINFPRFGELDVDGIVQGNEDFLTAFTERSRATIKSDNLRDQFLSLLDKYQFLFTGIGQASLCHEDLHQHNILFKRQRGIWHLTTILDFDKAWAGYHEIDLARMEFWRGMHADEYWKAYQAIHPVEQMYEQRRPIYQLLWCFEFARMTPEHLEDTRQLCAKLGLPQLEDFD